MSGQALKYDAMVIGSGQGGNPLAQQMAARGETVALIEAQRIFIDTGASPTIPPIAGLNSVPYLTNVSMLELTEVPQHLLVLGGGYVGLEFGQMFRRFGSEVTVVQSAERILPSEDDE